MSRDISMTVLVFSDEFILQNSAPKQSKSVKVKSVWQKCMNLCWWQILLVTSINCLWPLTLLFTDTEYLWGVWIDSCGENTSRFNPRGGGGYLFPRPRKWQNHFLTYSFPTMNCTHGFLLNNPTSEIALFISLRRFCNCVLPQKWMCFFLSDKR